MDGKVLKIAHLVLRLYGSSWFSTKQFGYRPIQSVRAHMGHFACSSVGENISGAKGAHLEFVQPSDSQVWQGNVNGYTGFAALLRQIPNLFLQIELAPPCFS